MRARREPSMILGLSRSAGVIEWMIAWIRSISRSSKFSSCSRNCPIPGSIPMIFDSEPILRSCCICCRKSSSVKSPPWPVSLAAALAAWSASKVFSACSIRVSMSPMSRIREAIRSGWNTSKSVELLAVGGEHHRLAGDRRDRQGGATAGVAVELGEHDAVVADAVEERLRGVDRVLADHRVDDEEDLVGRHRVADVRGLLHHLGVDAEAAGGVDDDDVVQGALGLGHTGPGHRHRVADAVARLGGEHLDAGPLAVDLELVDGVGALEVGGDQQRAVALLLEPQRELGGQRRLAGALEAGQHDHRRRGLREAQPAGLAAEDRDELLVDDLDDLLGGVERPADLLAAGPLLDRGDELS